MDDMIMELGSARDYKAIRRRAGPKLGGWAFLTGRAWCMGSLSRPYGHAAGAWINADRPLRLPAGGVVSRASPP
ncbi:hypothetical protein I6G79_04855 [Burkholderia plantarii]|nr:hypothetical protein [Burkholderia plantarii]